VDLSRRFSAVREQVHLFSKRDCIIEIERYGTNPALR
jgi:hypothetical protein